MQQEEEDLFTEEEEPKPQKMSQLNSKLNKYTDTTKYRKKGSSPSLVEIRRLQLNARANPTGDENSTPIARNSKSGMSSSKKIKGLSTELTGIVRSSDIIPIAFSFTKKSDDMPKKQDGITRRFGLEILSPRDDISVNNTVSKHSAAQSLSKQSSTKIYNESQKKVAPAAASTKRKYSINSDSEADIEENRKDSAALTKQTASKGSRVTGLPILALLGGKSTTETEESIKERFIVKQPKVKFFNSSTSSVAFQQTNMTFNPIFDPKIHKRGPMFLGISQMQSDRGDTDIECYDQEGRDNDQHDHSPAQKKQFQKLKPKNRFH